MILTSEQLETALREATEKIFPHFNKLDWLPEWKEGDPKPKLEPNQKKDGMPTFGGPKTLRYDKHIKDRMENLRIVYTTQLNHISRDPREPEDPQKPEPGTKLEQVPHPFSDVSHIDPGIFTGDEPGKLKDGAQLMRDLLKFGAKDGEAGNELRKASRSLDKIEEMLGDKAKGRTPMGMQRLKLIFEWTLCHVTALFGEINTALNEANEAKGQKDYTAARDEYIKLLHDLDDGEPETKKDPPESAKRGYGRVVKWAYFYPLIHSDDPDDPNVPARIKGVVVVAKWNPHISSSGIPIAHFPCIDRAHCAAPSGSWRWRQACSLWPVHRRGERGSAQGTAPMRPTRWSASGN
jgi:hypothetical protein